MFEGIHANPELIRNLPMDQIKRIYVSPLPPEHGYSHNRSPTTDERLLRRMVPRLPLPGMTPDYLRGHRFGGARSIYLSVSEGTRSLFQLRPGLRTCGCSSATPSRSCADQHGIPGYSEARRLLKSCAISRTSRPQHSLTSILREFFRRQRFRYCHPARLSSASRASPIAFRARRGINAIQSAIRLIQCRKKETPR
jgi:hypothetical protein